MAGAKVEGDLQALRTEIYLGEGEERTENWSGDIVLIALDGSEHSENAFTWYIQHLHRPTNYILLVHSIEMPNVPTRESWDFQMDAGNKKKSDLMESYMAKFKQLKLTGKLVSDFEKAGELIVDIARRDGATYVVMGTRGLGKIRRTVLGSVSDFVVHHAPCPVIVARNGKK